jgi:Tol biopolymer transport system component/tRNA A-37 threonylcarbamoyl transferase component Bud32
MTSERRQRIDRLLERALELAPEQRAAFLAEASAGDESLRREVESLLAYVGQAEDFIESPALEIAAEMTAEGEGAAAVPGQMIDHYRIASPLGAGGMGEVYLAEDTRLRRRVALKLLPASVSQDAERMRRFAQEARAAAKLSHPSVCMVHELGQTDEGRHFIAMEYVEGRTLRKRLAEGPLGLEEALEVARQVAEALQAAHGAGVVHRDIKPENLMLRPDGYVKVLDFGLAKLAEGRAAGKVADSAATTRVGVRTLTGVVMGTARYMSPEQAKGEHVDARSDVFSFGAVLYEMLTGEPAFGGESVVDTLHAIIHEEPEGLAGLSRRVDAGVAEVVRRCLEKAPERRYVNGGELAEALTPMAEASRWGAAAPARAQRGWHGRSSPWWIGLAAVVVLVGGAVWLGGVRPAAGPAAPTPPDSPLAAARTVPLTSLPGWESDPSFSPDGTEVAFTWTGEAGDNMDIYVKQIGGETQQRLTSDPEGDGSPVWSPDGRSIAFIRSSVTERSIYVMPAIGGTERKLLSVNFPRYMPVAMCRIDWSPDGKSIVYMDASGPPGPWRLYRLSVDTLETQPLTSPPAGSGGDLEPAYSPDGQMLAFVRMASGGSNDLYVVSAAGGEPKRLTFDNVWMDHPVWTPDGRSIVFRFGRSGGGSLWRISVDGGQPEPLGIGGDQARRPAISRQGQRLAYATALLAPSTIWRRELASASGKPHSQTKVLSSTAGDFSPQVSPDGKRIAFDSMRSGSSEIWVCDSDGSNPLQLTKLGGSGTPRWSPDGRFIAFCNSLAEQADIYVIGANGGVPRRLTEDPAADAVPSWSRDGRWIYFASNRTGEFQVWKMPAEGGEAMQVTKLGGYVAFESPDGAYLYYAKWIGYVPGLWRVPVEGGEEAPVLEGGPATWGLWGLAEKGIYFYETEGETPGAIKLFDPATRRVRRVAVLDPPPLLRRSSLAISPDGRWLLYVEDGRDERDLVLVENFR